MIAIYFVYGQYKQKSTKRQYQEDRNMFKPKAEQQSEPQLSYDADIESFTQILNEGCFDILSYYEMDEDQLIDQLIKKMAFSSKNPIEKL